MQFLLKFYFLLEMFRVRINFLKLYRFSINWEPHDSWLKGQKILKFCML